MAYSATIKTIVPEAPGRNHMLADRFLRSAVRYAQQSQIESAHNALRQALHYELGIGPHVGKPENPVLLYLQRLLETACRPALVAAFANVAWADKNFSAARALFRRYLEITPNAFDRRHVERTIAHLDGEVQRRAVPSTRLDRLINWVSRVLRRHSCGP